MDHNTTPRNTTPRGRSSDSSRKFSGFSLHSMMTSLLQSIMLIGTLYPEVLHPEVDQMLLDQTTPVRLSGFSLHWNDYFFAADYSVDLNTASWSTTPRSRPDASLSDNCITPRNRSNASGLENFRKFLCLFSTLDSALVLVT